MNNDTDTGCDATFANHSPSYQAKLNSVLALEQNLTTAMTLSVNIYSRSSLLYTTDRIKAIDILQHFNRNYCDIITVLLSVSPEIYNAIYTNSESLTIMIIGKRVTDESSDMDASYPVFSISGIALLADRRDLMARYAPSQITHDATNINSIENDDNIANTFPVMLQIIPDSMYDVRHIRANYILRDATIADAIRYAANLFKLKLFLAPPDNTRVYDQIVIPPMLGINDLFHWLQYSPGYGIYNQDISAYVTKDKLYVYPTNALTKSLDLEEPSFNIYRATPNSLVVDKGTTRIDTENNRHVIIDSQIESVENNEINFENLGNGLIIQRDEDLFDGIIQPADITPKTTRLMINRSITESVFVNQLSIPVINANNQKFAHSDGNYFKLYSQFSATQNRYFRFTWSHAIPYALLPITPIIFFYEDTGQIKQMRGLCRSIKYNITTAGQSAIRYYISQAEVTIALTEC